VSHTEQALAVLAAGLLIGQMTAGFAWSAARAFFASVLAGSVVGLVAPDLQWSSVLVTLSLVVLGSLVALRAELPGKFVAGMCLFFGLAVGYANGTQMLENLKMPIFYLGGLMVCVGLLLLYCSQVVRRFRASWAQVGVRVIGSWIAAAGVLMLSIQLK
jgi:hydrogenase/urease accessory protein HupE